MGDSRIKHIVVLMMENRSFDHLLGFMKRENPEIRGIVGGDFSNLTTAGVRVPVSEGAQFQGQLSDPGHDYSDVFLQMYGKPVGAPVGEPDMSGFVQSYEQLVGAGKGNDVMCCFTSDQLPVISALARSYAVCDQWFSSVPGPTLPNRAFAHFGTSFGRLDMSPEYFRAKQSIYQRLRQKTDTRATGRIYYFDPASSTQGLTFLLNDQGSYFGGLGDFIDDCRRNKLPAYSFIEPNYSDHDATLACDQHPDNNMLAGDAFIGQIYNAIRRNDAVWQSTLFLIVWDEHGGLYDHVAPPKVNRPDHDVSTSPPFAFDRLGVRVPAVIVSPYVEAGVVDHTVYEHASIPATVTAQFIGDPHVHSPSSREQWASTFLHLLTRTQPRTDRPSFGVPNAVGGVHALAAGVPSFAAAASEGSAVADGGRPMSKLLQDQIRDTLDELRRHHPVEARTLGARMAETHQQAADLLAAAHAVMHPAAAAKKTGGARRRMAGRRPARSSSTRNAASKSTRKAASRPAKTVKALRSKPSGKRTARSASDGKPAPKVLPRAAPSKKASARRSPAKGRRRR